MKKNLVLLSSALSLAISLSAQTSDIISDPNKLLAVLQKEQFDIDPNAKAVVLYREQNSLLDDRGYIEKTYEFSAKILSDVAAQDLSLINVSHGDYSTVYSISGETYNLENGKVVKQEMEKKEVKDEKMMEAFKVTKFNLPAVKKGSVIHYIYKVRIPVYVFVPDYYLQLNYPILLQEYNLRVPGTINYQKFERINVPLTLATSKKILDTCQAGVWSESYGNNGTVYTWVRRNEPAFTEEPFMASEDNYKERVKLQITTWGGMTLDQDWNAYIKHVYFDNNNYYIGSVFKSNGFFDDKIKELTATSKSDIEKATAIYKFVRDSFNVKYQNREFSLRTTFNDRWGSEGAINLVLIGMLRRAKLECNPVLVSSRKNEHLNPIYQDMGNVDQILAQVIIDKKTIFLNAAEKNLPFATLLPESYNGYSQVINEKPWSIQLEPKDCKEKSASVYNIAPSTTKGNLTMKVDIRLGNYEAYLFRKAMQNDTSKIRKEIITQLKKGSLSVDIKQLEVQNLNNPEGALKIQYEGEIALDPNVKTIYFNPFFDPFYEENPFPATTRKYTIEMDYLTDKNYIMNIKLPENYEIDDFAKSKSYKYDEAGTLAFNNLWEFDDATKTLHIKSRLTTNETYFQPEHYEGLRNFYDKIVEEQQQKIVIKKTDLN